MRSKMKRIETNKKGKKILCTEKVDDAVVVAGEQPDEVLKKRHERRVYHAIVDLCLPRLYIVARERL